MERCKNLSREMIPEMVWRNEVLTAQQQDAKVQVHT
jgi:hypothetical protein